MVQVLERVSSVTRKKQQDAVVDPEQKARAEAPLVLVRIILVFALAVGVANYEELIHFFEKVPVIRDLFGDDEAEATHSSSIVLSLYHQLESLPDGTLAHVDKTLLDFPPVPDGTTPIQEVLYLCSMKSPSGEVLLSFSLTQDQLDELYSLLSQQTVSQQSEQDGRFGVLSPQLFHTSSQVELQ